MSPAVTLNPGATLTLAFVGSGTVPVGTVYTLIANDGSDAVVGTFAGLPQGKIFTANGQFWQISYTGGDGNDVTLQAVLPPPPPPPPPASTAAPASATISARWRAAGRRCGHRCSRQSRRCLQPQPVGQLDAQPLPAVPRWGAGGHRGCHR
jgi:hypothetical protein